MHNDPKHMEIFSLYCHLLRNTFRSPPPHSLQRHFVEVVPIDRTDQVGGVGDLLDVGYQGLLVDGIHHLHLLHQGFRGHRTA